MTEPPESVLAGDLEDALKKAQAGGLTPHQCAMTLCMALGYMLRMNPVPVASGAIEQMTKVIVDSYHDARRDAGFFPTSERTVQ